jgi:hypothetical protein
MSEVATMRTSYVARVKDLGPTDFVLFECACGRIVLLTKSMLQLCGLHRDDRIMNLAWRMRCRQCDERGKVTIAIKWAS